MKIIKYVLYESIELLFYIPIIYKTKSYEVLVYQVFFYMLYINNGYVIFQALALIKFKQTKDPIEGISKLGYMQLVSTNQMVTEQFMENMYQDREWKSLTSEQQKTVLEAFD